MTEPRNSYILGVPALLCGAMLLVGIVTARMAGISGTGLVLPYVATATAFVLLAGLTFAFTEFAKLAVARADNPVPAVLLELKSRAPLLPLPVLMFPLLLTGYTTAKAAIPTLVGYSWERFWADADKFVFRDDAWILSRPLVEWAPVPLWEWVYSAGWGLVLFAWLAAIPFYARRKNVGVMYTAMFLAWIIGGWLLAYLTSAAGPVFAHITDPGLADRFQPLRDHLQSLDPNGPIRMSQHLLTTGLEERRVLTGSGISAMPSMHLAAATIYVIASWRSVWLLPSVAFWIVIFIGSAYFGYHYWLDGIVAAAVAAMCWLFARSIFQRVGLARPSSSGPGIAAVPPPSERTKDTLIY